MSDKPNPAIERMTDGGIFIIGDKVIYDGEAEKMGVPPLEDVPNDDPETPEEA